MEPLEMYVLTQTTKSYNQPNLFLVIMTANIHGDTNKTIASRLMNLDISNCGIVSIFLISYITLKKPIGIHSTLSSWGVLGTRSG